MLPLGLWSGDSLCVSPNTDLRTYYVMVRYFRVMLFLLPLIAKILLDEANDFSCATTDVLAFKMLCCTSFF